MVTRTEQAVKLVTGKINGLDVTVPAGTFTAVYIQKVSATGGSAKTYWYVPGVGKVKELGGQLEELVSYSLAP